MVFIYWLGTLNFSFFVSNMSYESDNDKIPFKQNIFRKWECTKLRIIIRGGTTRPSHKISNCFLIGRLLSTPRIQRIELLLSTTTALDRTNGGWNCREWEGRARLSTSFRPPPCPRSCLKKSILYSQNLVNSHIFLELLIKINK